MPGHSVKVSKKRTIYWTEGDGVVIGTVEVERRDRISQSPFTCRRGASPTFDNEYALTNRVLTRVRAICRRQR